ncbi:MAG: hypothetical protein LBI14_05180 [Treponema sp.]|jgi:hypothetical protein|nr:hypothetical protein [Treponema sp.]
MEEKIEIFKRANFFPGLQVGPAYWNAVEDYHFNKEQLYNRLFHGFGVVAGYLDSLQVQSQKTRGGLITLLVSRGIAVDGLGRPLFLYEPQVLVLDPKKFKLPVTAYVTIKYEERLDEYYQNKDNPDLQGYQKRLETVKLDVVAEIHEPDLEIELARIQLVEEEGGDIQEVRNNENFTDPGPNTLDYRFVPFASRMKKGVSTYLFKFLIELLDYTLTVAASGYEVLPLVPLRNLQNSAMNAKMIAQCAGISFEDMIYLITPLFDFDHQILFEISEYERKNEEKGRLYTSKNAYEIARAAMYELGDRIKSYSCRYEEIDLILKSHKAIMENLKQVLITNEISDDDIKYISYAMPHVLLFGEDRYTLVDTVNLGSRESIESHQFELLGGTHPSTSNEAFYYPDGVLVHDTVKRWIGGSMQFHLRNIIRGRKTLIIRRTDIFHGNYSVEVSMEGTEMKILDVDGIDTRQRWRNLFVVYDEGEIKDNTGIVKFSIGEKGRDNSGSIWIYQML